MRRNDSCLRHALAVLFLLATGLCAAQTPPSLHVEGRNLVDSHGNTVVLHGAMDTPNCWFNGGTWGWMSYDDANAPGKCVAYFDKVFKHMTDTAGGLYCNLFRLHLDPCWTNGSKTAAGFTKKGDKWYDPDGVEVGGESDIKNFDMARLKKFWSSVYWPIANKALNRGMHVIMRPPGVCPHTIKVGSYYQKYLKDVWGFVSSQTNMKKFSGQVSIELANEPINMQDEKGQWTARTMHDFFQPIVDTIRANGFTGIIWVPGTGYQSNYREYIDYPIEGYNIGYAVHVYPGWYGNSDENTSAKSFIQNFGKQVPVVNTNPICVTEIDWSPGTLKLDANGKPIDKGDGNYETENYGTWGTARTSTWGKSYKAMKDHYGNISMTLTSIDDIISTKEAYNNDRTVISHGDKPQPEEGCAYACAQWYKEYAQVNQAYPDYKNLSTNLTSDQKKFVNPVIAADFPDPDVTQLGDTYYMLSTTMYLQPGATVLKSKDLVNWEYCANPLEQLSTADKYNLIDGKHSYAGGMWAGAIEAHDGKLYILLNCNDAGAFVLSTDNPEGRWDVKKLDRGYYDPGMIFEGDKIYVVCGIGNIAICELDKDWNFKKSTEVIKGKDGLEGCHLYHIGDYYYIYATYGGWPSGQAIFRSKNITGTYEEKMLIEKTINGVPNTVHQGALMMTDTGEWWTMLMEDKGAIGRMPSLHPVTWADGWPTLCKSGVPQLSYTRPQFRSYPAVSVLPTNDNFRHYQLGKQWQWNHGVSEGSWSLLERPGFLRMHTSTVTDEMMLARGTLTQRIFAFHKATSPYGLDTSKPSTGTVALDVRGMKVGDMAGIAVQQDPYAMLGVTLCADGSYSLLWKSGSHTGTDNFTPKSKTVEGLEIDSTIYLRAKFSCDDSKATFFYSQDNKTWKQVGDATGLRYNLSVFVGARWAIFNYATQELGGHVDVDWFTTEDEFEEARFTSSVFEGYSEDMLTAAEITTDEEHVMMPGNSQEISIMATFKDGTTKNVAGSCTYSIDNGDIATVDRGIARGITDGVTTATATYTDPMGNEFTVSFKVKVTTFPLLEKYVDARMFGEGYFKEATGELHLTQYGCGGWWFHSGIDLSAYKYVVLKFKKTPPSGLQLHVYDVDNYWAAAADISLGTSKTQKVTLANRKKSSGGGTLNTKDIRIFGIWAPSNTSIYIDDIFVSNDGKNPVAIDEIEASAPEAADNGIYDLLGRRVDRPTRGVYIIGGKKVMVK